MKVLFDDFNVKTSYLGVPKCRIKFSSKNYGFNPNLGGEGSVYPILGHTQFFCLKSSKKCSEHFSEKYQFSGGGTGWLFGRKTQPFCFAISPGGNVPLHANRSTVDFFC